MQAFNDPQPPAAPHAFSVIIPCYNQGRFLKQAYESVLQQSVDAEVIVVNDGSTDNTRGVIDSLGGKIRAIHQPNQGVSVARNAGAKAAAGRLLVFLDADDVLLPNALADFRDAAVRQPEAGVYYGRVRKVDAQLRLISEADHRSFDDDPLAAMTVFCQIMTPGAAAIQKKAIERVGGFDPGIPTAQDWDLWIRLAEHGVRFCCVDAIVLNYRKHDDAATTSYFRMMQAFKQVQGKHKTLIRRTHRSWLLRHAVAAVHRFYWWRSVLRPHVYATARGGHLGRAVSLCARAATESPGAVWFYTFEIWCFTMALYLARLLGHDSQLMRALK